MPATRTSQRVWWRGDRSGRVRGCVGSSVSKLDSSVERRYNGGKSVKTGALGYGGWDEGMGKAAVGPFLRIELIGVGVG